MSKVTEDKAVTDARHHHVECRKIVLDCQLCAAYEAGRQDGFLSAIDKNLVGLRVKAREEQKP